MGKKGKTSTNDFLDILEDSEEESSDSSLLWRSKEKSKKKDKKFGLLDKNKPKTKLVQTQDKPKTKLVQTQDKPKTKLVQTQDKPTHSKLPKNAKPKTQPRTNLGQNLRQSADKPKTIPLFSELVGLQRKLLILLFDSCQINGSTCTENITIESLFLTLGNPKSSIQKTLQRIEKKGFIERKSYKNGRGGSTIYELPKSVYQQVLQNETQDKLRTNLRQSTDKPKSQPRTQPRTMVSSSSSDLFNSLNLKKNTTTTELNISDQKVSMISIPPEVAGIGFSKAHLNKIFKNSSSDIEMVQESLDNMASDLREGRTQRLDSALSVIIGVLLKGQPYSSQAAMKLRDESTDEYLNKVHAHDSLMIEIKKHEAEIKLVQMYEKWLAPLTETEKSKFISYNDLVRPGTKFENAMLFEYYKNHIHLKK